MPHVHRHDTGTVYTVTNLGWLLRHRHDVDHITVEKRGKGKMPKEALLTATLSPGVTLNFPATYTCAFASHAVCVDFVTQRWAPEHMTVKG